jgi:hypothetical protein
MGIVYDCPISEKRKRYFRRFNCDLSAKLHYANICNEYIGLLVEDFIQGKDMEAFKKKFFDRFFNNVVQRSEIIEKHKEELFNSIPTYGRDREKQLKQFEELLKISKSWLKTTEK